MNKIKGDAYELFILNHLITVENYDCAWLWKNVPEKVLFEENIIDDYADYSYARNDIGIDIIALKDNKYIYVQCKNYEESICVQDLAGYYYFKALFEKKTLVYYNGKLSKGLKYYIKRKKIEFINVPFINKNNAVYKEDKVYEIREYQQEAVQLLKNKRRAVINLPCGMGKTYLSCLLATDNNNIIFFAPTKELCVQTFGVYQNYFKDYNCCLISGDGTRDIKKIKTRKKNIFVSTFKSCDVINTIINKLEDPYIIIDEFHNISQNDIANKKKDFYEILHSDYRILFLSATPRHLNNTNIFGNAIYKYNWNDAIKSKYINDFEITLPTSNYTNMKFDDFAQLFKVDYDDHLNYKYVRKMYFILRSILFNGNKKCLIYLPTTDKAQECEIIIGWMMGLFNRTIHTAIIDYETNKMARTNIIDDFVNNNEISIILNVHVLDEGINIPECDSVFITNPSKNIENIVQRMSRCNRIHPSKGKSSIYLWCNESKMQEIMNYINNNTGNELFEKFNRIDFGLNKLIKTNNTGNQIVNCVNGEKDFGPNKLIKTSDTTNQIVNCVNDTSGINDNTVVQNNVRAKISKYDCVYCNYQTDNKSAWCIHKKSLSHIKLEKNRLKNVLSQDSKYNCICCDYQTNCRNSWYVHKKTKKHILNNQTYISNSAKENNELLFKQNEIELLKEKLRSSENEKKLIRELYDKVNTKSI